MAFKLSASQRRRGDFPAKASHCYRLFAKNRTKFTNLQTEKGVVQVQAKQRSQPLQKAEYFRKTELNLAAKGASSTPPVEQIA